MSTEHNSAALARQQLAQDAILALVPLMGVLQRLTANSDDDNVAAAHQLAIRGEELARIAMEAVDADCTDEEDLAELRCLLRGPEANRRAVREQAGA